MRNHPPIPSSRRRRRPALTVPNSMFVGEWASESIVGRPSNADAGHRMRVHRVGTTGFPLRAISAGVRKRIEHRTTTAELWRDNNLTTTNRTVMAWRRGTSPCLWVTDGGDLNEGRDTDEQAFAPAVERPPEQTTSSIVERKLCNRRPDGSRTSKGQAKGRCTIWRP